MKVFLRVDMAMATVVAGRVVDVEMPEAVNGLPAHRCIWRCAPDTAMREWLAAQDPASYSVVGDEALVAVSFSTLTAGLARLIRARSVYARVSTTQRHPGAVAINGDVGYEAGVGWCLMATPALTPTERTFADMARGIDLYYQYSDCINTWRRGEARMEKLRRDGKDLGLSGGQMDSIIAMLTSR